MDARAAVVMAGQGSKGPVLVDGSWASTSALRLVVSGKKRGDLSE